VFSSDVVGSLLRPAYLKDARDRFAAGKLSDAAFKQVEDRAVDECIELQIRAGIEVITDGEVRRYAFYGHLIDAVEGFDKYSGWAIPFRDEKGEQLILPRPVVFPSCGADGLFVPKSLPMCAPAPITPPRQL
jgi:5-methyltetrahydropteroyltriglutamate--homocysteine methyltransferase